MAERREFDKRERRPRKRPAKLLEGDTKLNYKNVELLTNFITERKKIARDILRKEKSNETLVNITQKK